jgi:DNA-binding LacI/PurR family transcriptional regulator
MPMPPSRPARIADVAAAAGVGVGTVSRVINGASNVRESTRATVQQAIERLGYRPSHLAVALSRGTPRAVAIVVPHLTSPSVVPRLAGALAVLSEQGYDSVVCNVDTPAQRDHHLAALTGRHRAAGVIVVSLRLPAAQAEQFRRSGTPLVAIDMVIPGVPHTVTDDVAGGRMAAGYLLSLGHRKIGFVGDTMRGAAAAGRLLLGFASSHRRLAGYRQALVAAGADQDPALVRRGPHGPANAEALAAGLLALPDPPTAIFAASDRQAIGVLAAADRGGVKVPGELSVMGFDDIESAALMGLSTIRQQLWESGAEGARRLCALLRGDRVIPLRQQLSLEVVPRSSTAPVHAGRAERAADSPTTTSECALTGISPRDAGGHR